MSSDNNTVIYKEALSTGGHNSYDEALDPAVVSFTEQDLEDHGDGVTVFEEEYPLDMTLEDALEPFVDGDNDLGDIAEEAEGLRDEIHEIIEDHGDITFSELIPGADVSSKDINGAEPERETDYANDGDLSKFMDHVSELYPSKIPRHDGRSTVGCERAISFLDRLNGDISRAIRDDHENVLDIAKLEDVRVNIMRDVLVLKDHLSNLKKQIKENHSKKSSDFNIPNWKTAEGKSVSYAQLKEEEEIRKKAATPNNIVIAVSPFERAISGMMINAHISSGHPMEEVYASLKDKYELTDREELSIMQLCMDSGYHIFKDRGSYAGGEQSNDESKRGIDFVRNYFA